MVLMTTCTLTLPDGYTGARLTTSSTPKFIDGKLVKLTVTSATGGLRWAHVADKCLACGKSVAEHLTIDEGKK